MIRSPVQLPITALIAAGATLDALTGWQFETPDTDCAIEVIEKATAVGLLSTLTTAGDTIKQDANVPAGGTAGVTPARLATEPIVGKAPKFQKLRLFIRNPTGGGITFDAVVVLRPLGGVAGVRVGGFANARRRKPAQARRRGGR